MGLGEIHDGEHIADGRNFDGFRFGLVPPPRND